MYFKQFYLNCLAHASYLIGSGGEAVVVDPQRDVDIYIDEAARNTLNIRYVIETHLHADFVSGHHELAERTGAVIVFGARANAEFDHLAVSDGDELCLGDVVLRALETPGHTPESMSWLVIDGSSPGRPWRVLTGDTLFIGDVGRPDLVGSKGYTPEMMAGMMYDSLHGRILVLPDETEIWPAHGAGSACGKNLSKETSSTLAVQRVMNWALQPMSREDFVRALTTDLAEPPKYFPMDAEINRRGARSLADLALRHLTPAEGHALIAGGAIVLDVRDATSFGRGHIPGSINIGLGGQYASWAGQVLAADVRIVLVADSREGADEGVTRLARVGLENVDGWIEEGIQAWDDAGFDIAFTPQWTVAELHGCTEPGLRILDVRTENEFRGGHLPFASNIPLHELPRRLSEVDRTAPLAVVCEGGYRSSIAASLLERAGCTTLVNVTGGTSAWARAGFPVVT